MKIYNFSWFRCLKECLNTKYLSENFLRNPKSFSQYMKHYDHPNIHLHMLPISLIHAVVKQWNKSFLVTNDGWDFCTRLAQHYVLSCNTYKSTNRSLISKNMLQRYLWQKFFDVVLCKARTKISTIISHQKWLVSLFDNRMK